MKKYLGKDENWQTTDEGVSIGEWIGLWHSLL
jgi:hypothetical protein